MNLLKTMHMFVSKHSTEILTGVGIGCMVGATVAAVKATPKAMYLIEEAENKKEQELLKDEPEGIAVVEEATKLTPIETIKVAWKPYIPTAILIGSGIACLISANSIGRRREAMLAAAYALSERTFAEYKDKVVETIGEKKEKEVRDKVAEERVAQNPVAKSEVIILPGNTLFMDYYSQRYFESDLETMRKIENKLNKQMLNEDYISLSDVYDEIGISHTANSDDLGWNISREGMIDFGLENPHAAVTDDGRPCIVLDYRVGPRYDFSSAY